MRFAIPADEYDFVLLLRLQFQWQRKRVRKSELLRAAVHMLGSMPMNQLTEAIRSLRATRTIA